MTRYYLYYGTGTRFLLCPGVSKECREQLADSGTSRVGVAFELHQGRLAAAFLSLTPKRRSGTYEHVPISQADGDALVPLQERQKLWEQAMSEYMMLGLIAE